MKPSDGSAGVVSTFAIATLPVSSSISVASVNVPPMSIARRTLIALLRSSAVAPSSSVASVDRDAVDLPRALGADLALEHVAQDALRVALLGRAVAAAAAGADADHVARHELDRRLRAEPGLRAVADEDVLRHAPVVPAERAPRAAAVAVGEDRERRVQVEAVVLAQAEPAAEAARALGVLDQREPVDPHRVVELGLLDRRVLGVLAVRLHRVGAVAREAAAVAAGEGVVEAGVGAGGDVEQPNPAWHIIPFVPAGSRSGNAGRSARNITSTSRVCVSQPPTTGAGQVQLVTVPARRVEPDEAVEAVVHRQVGVDQALERVRAGREGLRVGRVDRRAPLRVGAGVSKRTPSGAELDARAQAHGLVGVAVVVDGALGLVDAVRQRRELGARAPLGVVEQLVHRREDRLAAVALDQRLHAAHAGRVRGDLRAEVAGRLVLRADLREDQPEDVGHDLPALDELHRRDDHALLEDLAERADATRARRRRRRRGARGSRRSRAARRRGGRARSG